MLENAATSKVVAASLFKNGFAVVVREWPLKDGEAIIEDAPQASLGTFWLTTSKGLKIAEARTMLQRTPGERDAASVDELLGLNVGKTVTLILTDGKTEMGKLTLVSQGMIMLQTKAGVAAHPRGLVRSILAEAPLNFKVKTETDKRVVRVVTSTKTPGFVYTFGLERGMTWAPAYSLDISDPKKLSITAKATVMNDLADLEGIEARFITGFPNLPFQNLLDPFTAGMAVQEFSNQMMTFGGGGGLGAPGAMSQNALRRDARGSFSESFDIPDVAGSSAEDLFFYPCPNVNLKRGERGYYVLFVGESEYKHIYTWDANNSIDANERYVGVPEEPGDVWHSLEFKNNTNQPWTTAPVITTQGGELLGQDTLNYTARGAETRVKITKALDIRADQLEEELTREQINVRVGPNDTRIADLVTLKGTLELRNMKTQDVTLSITREVVGEVDSADENPTITKVVKGLRAINPRTRLAWNLNLKGGESKRVTFTYKVKLLR